MNTQRLLPALLLTAALPAAAQAGWQDHYSVEGISAAGRFEHFGKGGIRPVAPGERQSIRLGSLSASLWVPKDPVPAPIPTAREGAATQFRHAGIGGDNTP